MRAQAEPKSLRAMTAPELIAHGKRAFDKHDHSTVGASIAELERRGGKAARLGAAELGELASPDEVPESATIPRLPAQNDAKHWEQFTDERVETERFRLIRSARRSIWLSSYTFASKKLTDLLVEQAQRIREVRMIVGNSFYSHHKHQRAVARLERAGVLFVNPRATHSKLLIVDDRFTMNGSANAHGVYRDFCIVHDDPRIASAAKRYLLTLVTGSDRTPASSRGTDSRET